MKIITFMLLGCLFVPTSPSLSSRGGINNLDSVIHDANFSKWPLGGARVSFDHLVALDGARAPQNGSGGFGSDLV